MSDQYQYFQQEMRYLRQSVDAFSQTYPEVAAELKLSAGRSNDPHVEQMIQSFAYMTGQLRADLDKQVGQIPNQLLYSLYPNLMRSVPCMTVLQANVLPDGANFVNGYCFNKGRQLNGKATRINKHGQSEEIQCKFSNCYDTQLWPLTIDKIEVLPRNHFDFVDKLPQVQSVMSIKIKNIGTEVLSQYPIEQLRFYIADISERSQLYRLLADKLVGCAIRVGEQVVHLDDFINKQDSAIEWQGFADEQNVLPDDVGSQRAYRLLQEYFVFVENFYFFDIGRIGEKQALKNADKGFELLLLLDEASRSVRLNKSSLGLNCFPVINLYDKVFKPIQLQQNKHEYRVLADEQNYLHGEVHSIKEVRSIGFDGTSNSLSAWMGPKGQAVSKQYYIARLNKLITPGEHGCDTYLSIYDEDFCASQPVDQTIAVQGLCNNRRLPEALRIGQDLQLIGPGPMHSAQVVMMPTKFKGASLDNNNGIKLLSQLSLNLDSLGIGEDRLQILKQMLRLYSDPLSVSHQRQLNGLMKMSTSAVVKRVGGQMWRGHCRGTLVSLNVNEDYFVGANPLLLGGVLSYFFGLYTTLNHFVQLQLTSDRREGVWKQWLPRIGEQVIL